MAHEGGERDIHYERGTDTEEGGGERKREEESELLRKEEGERESRAQKKNETNHKDP